MTSRNSLLVHVVGQTSDEKVLQPLQIAKQEVIQAVHGEIKFCVDDDLWKGKHFHGYWPGVKHGVVFVFDVCSRETFADIQESIDVILRQIESGLLPITFRNAVIAGNDTGQRSAREISLKDGKQLGAKYGMPYFDTRSRSTQEFEELLTRLFNTGMDQLTNLGVVTKDEESARNTFENQPLELNLYLKALSEGTERERFIRVNVVGNWQQGKTSLVKRLMNKSVAGVESTNGIDVQRFKCKRSPTGKLLYKKATKTSKDFVKRLENVQLGGIDMLSTAITVPGSEIAAVSGTSYTPPPKDVYSADEDDAYLSDRSRKTVVRFDTSSVTEITVDEDEGGDLEAATRVNKPFLKLKEKKKICKALKKEPGTASFKPQKTRFDFWDFGGQFVFYATHSLFHSRSAIYLLVFDLSVPLSKEVSDEDFPGLECKRTMEYYLKFWMNSIHAFVGTKDGKQPVVILVGTHKDQVPGNDREKSAAIGRIFEKIRSLFDGTPLVNHIYEEDFAVDNKSHKDPSIAALRETILRIGEERSNTIHVPAKWIQLEQALDEMKEKKIILLQTVLDIDKTHEVPLGDVEQVKLFLKYHHSKGTYIYFDEKPLSKYVIIEPRLLIDAFRRVITSGQFCMKNTKMRPLWNLLLAEARLEHDLINYQWDKDKLMKQHKDVLIRFLEKHHIITHAMFFDESTQNEIFFGWYIVPSLLRVSSTKQEMQDVLKGKPHTLLQLVLIFELSTIVPLIFHRLLAALTAKWPLVNYVVDKTTGRTSKVMIFQNACIVKLNNFAGIARMESKSICLSVVSLCPSSPINSEVVDAFRRFCQTLVHHEFRKLQSSVESHAQPYKVAFKCNDDDHGCEGSEGFIETGNEKIVHCPDFQTHDINVENACSEWYTASPTVDVPSDVYVTERMLSNLSQCVGENWELLGTELGLTSIQVSQIKQDFTTTTLRIFQMFLKWKNQVNDASLQNLVHAMKKANTAVTIDWDIVRNVLDDMEKEQ